MIAGLSMSAKVLADVLPTEPFCTYQLECLHPDEPNYRLGEDDIVFDIKGKVKTVQVSSKQNIDTYKISEQGLIIGMSHRSAEGKSKYDYDKKYEYDANNRLIATKEFAKGKITETKKFSYFDDKNMVIRKYFNQQKGWLTSFVLIHSHEENKGDIYYRLFVSNINLSGEMYVLSVDRKQWIYSKLFGTGLVSKDFAKTEKDGDILLSSGLSCLKGINCPEGWNISKEKVFIEKSKDGVLDKYSSSEYVKWFKDGLIDQHIGEYGKLSDGTVKHGIYKYQFDEKGNWVKRDMYLPEEKTITDDKPKYTKIDNDENLTRKIEYYD